MLSNIQQQKESDHRQEILDWVDEQIEAIEYTRNRKRHVHCSMFEGDYKQICAAKSYLRGKDYDLKQSKHGQTVEPNEKKLAEFEQIEETIRKAATAFVDVIDQSTTRKIKIPSPLKEEPNHGESYIRQALDNAGFASIKFKILNANMIFSACIKILD